MAYRSGKKNPFTDARKAKFLEEYAKCGIIGVSARKAGVERTTIYGHMDRDEDFKLAVEDAYKDYCDLIDTTIAEHALKGFKKGVWHQGEKVGTEIVFDTTLRLAHAKRHMSEYRDKSGIDLNANIQGGILAVAGVLPLDDWAKLAEGAERAPAPDEQ